MSSPITSRVTLDADRVIQGGNSIRVYSVVIANSTSSIAEVDLARNDTNQTKILTITVPAQATHSEHLDFMADQGLQILGLGDANVIVTVLHSQSGA